MSNFQVLHAYLLLVEQKDPEKEKGYVAALYSGIKCCLMDKHLHLQAKTEYIAQLIARAEPELLGNHRERHAKTMEIAQEEVFINYYLIIMVIKHMVDFTIHMCYFIDDIF